MGPFPVSSPFTVSKGEPAFAVLFGVFLGLLMVMSSNPSHMDSSPFHEFSQVMEIEFLKANLPFLKFGFELTKDLLPMSTVLSGQVVDVPFSSLMLFPPFHGVSSNLESSNGSEKEFP